MQKLISKNERWKSSKIKIKKGKRLNKGYLYIRVENLHKNILQKTEAEETSAFLKYHKALYWYITSDNKQAIFKKS